MTLGKFSEKITFLAPATAADGLGGGVFSFTAVGSAWAEVTPVRARESDDRGAVRETQSYLFRMHRRADITAVHVIEWAGRRFNIREVRLPPSREIFMTIEAETGVTL